MIKDFIIIILNYIYYSTLEIKFNCKNNRKKHYQVIYCITRLERSVGGRPVSIRNKHNFLCY